jgi:hypothetical protein
MEKHRVSQHWRRIKYPEICFDCPHWRIGRQKDLDGAEDVANQDQGDRDVEADGCHFNPSFLTLLENAFRGAPAVEDGNDRDEGDVEEELNDQTGLEEGKVGTNGAVGGVEAKEDGGTLRDDGDNSGEEDAEDGIDKSGGDGSKRGLGR